jgi:aquaporin Z
MKPPPLISREVTRKESDPLNALPKSRAGVRLRPERNGLTVTRNADEAVLPKGVLADWVRPLIVESIGPFALTFMGVAAIISTGGRDLVAIALAHGLAIGLMVAAGGHISGGVYNPALAVGLVVGKRLSPIKGAAYIIAQLVGAVFAAALITIIFKSSDRDAVNFGATTISPGHDIGQAIVMEVVLTFFLMFAVFGNAIDPRGKKDTAALAIGLIVTMDIFAGGAVTGAAMNPSRSFGVALIGNIWTDHLVYWVAPILGASLAAALYAFVLMPQEEDA